MSALRKAVRNVYLRYKWRGRLRFGYSCDIGRSSIFEGANKIGRGTYFRGTMGYGSYIGADASFHGKVGRFTSIAAECCVIRGKHPYTYPFATTCPMFFSLLRQNGHTFADSQRYDEFKYAEPGYAVVVGSDCWIGLGVKIIQGVSIGDGTIVLAGAVVTKSTPLFHSRRNTGGG